MKAASKYSGFISFIAMLILLAGNGYSQSYSEVLPSGERAQLKTLIHKAYQNNHQLKSLQEKVDGLYARADYSGSLMDPVVGFALANVPTDDFKMDKEPMTQKQIFISQNLPWPGKRSDKKSIDIYEAEIMKETLRKEKLALAKKITERYYQLGYLNRALLTNKTLIERITSVKNVAITYYKSGKGSRQSIYQAEVSLGLLRDEQIEIKKKRRTIALKINELINNDSFLEISPPPLPDFQKVTLNSKKIIETALRMNPDVIIARKEISKRATLVNLAEKESLPDTTLKLSYGQREDDRVDFLSVSASFNLPVYKKKRQDQKLRFAEKNNSAGKESRDYLTVTLPYRIEAIIDEIHDICSRHLLYESTIIPQAEKWSEASMNDYTVGKISFDTLISAHINELKHKLKKEQYQFDILIRAAELRELTGEIDYEHKTDE